MSAVYRSLNGSSADFLFGNMGCRCDWNRCGDACLPLEFGILVESVDRTMVPHPFLFVTRCGPREIGMKSREEEERERRGEEKDKDGKKE